MSVIVTNPSPKARFQMSNETVSKHRDMVGSREFERAADFAMLQYQSLVTDQIKDTNTALAASFKMQGALEFLQTMRLLAESPKMPKPSIVDDNLDHRS